MKQISFLDYGEFFKNKSEEELVELYSVTGGVPKYIEMFADESAIFDGIQKNILNKQSFLYEEPTFLAKNPAESGKAESAGHKYSVYQVGIL